MLKKSSPLILLSQLEPNFTWMKFRKSYTKIPHFAIIGQYAKNLLLFNYCASWNQTSHEKCLEGSLQKILISFWSDKKHGRHRHSCFWLANIQEILSETTVPVGTKHCRNGVWKIYKQNPNFVAIWQKHGCQLGNWYF